MRQPRSLGEASQFVQAGYAIAPFTGPAAPFVAAGTALTSLVLKLAHLFGPDPRKRPDTQVLEAAVETWNQVWYQVSGEALDGVRRTAPPGDYGKMHVQLFGVSTYPDVPAGAAGDPQVDINQAISVAQQIYQQAAQAMQRPQSVDNLNGNFQAVMNRLQAVAQARAPQAAISGSGAAGILGSGIPAWLPLAAAGVLLVAVMS